MPDPRGYAATIVIGLAGAGSVVVGVARPWISATADQAGLPPVLVSLSGADIVPLAGALGLVMLAGFGAVIATRGKLRRAIGVVIVGCAVACLLLAVRPPGATGALREELADHGWAGGPYTQSAQVWRLLVVVGALACVLAGAAVVRLGARWPVMGNRYDAPAAQASATSSTRGAADDSWSETEVWKAIDRGHDPTVGPDASPER